MKIIALEQGTPEWLEFRKEHIGASEAPIIMGVSPWSTPFKLWNQKLGLAPPQTDNSAMKRGSELEPYARRKLCDLKRVVLSPAVAVSDERPYIMASFDGVSACNNIIAEIKCPGIIDHDIAKGGQVPEKYIPQLQQQLYVANLESMLYFSYVNDDNYAIIEVKRDRAYQDLLLAAIDKFWLCLQNFISPPLLSNDFEPRVDAKWQKKAAEWRDVKKQVVELEEVEHSLRNELIELTNGQNCQGGGIRLTKVLRQGNVDYKSIPELKGVNLDLYRKAHSESWRIITMD